ncbi:MAG: potassium channel protein [Myxococcota bacterium]
MSGPVSAARRLVQQGYDLFVAFDNLVGPLLLLVTTTVVGTVGYKVLLDLNWLDAAYQSVITLSTVGFSEVVPFNDGAKVFTIVLVFFGVGAVFYVITLLAATVVEGEARRKIIRRLMMRKVEALQDHFVVCGFGKVGREIAIVLAGRNQPFVILDIDSEALADAEELGYLVVNGNAESEEVQRRAGVDRAQSVVAATESDSLNTYITLVARSLNPQAYIVARSESHTSEQKLMLAGAQRVISPYAIGARRMALSALQPMMADFMDVLAEGRLGDQLIAEIDISPDSIYLGQALAEVFQETSNTTVLAIRRADQSLIVGPRGNAILEAGDIVIVLADEKDLSLLRPGNPGDPTKLPASA